MFHSLVLLLGVPIGDYTIANLSVSPRTILRGNVRLCLTGLTACHSWSKETVDGCMSSKISTIRNVSVS